MQKANEDQLILLLIITDYCLKYMYTYIHILYIYIYIYIFDLSQVTL